jgi:predicted SAM-dependent methyltransferase
MNMSKYLPNRLRAILRPYVGRMQFWIWRAKLKWWKLTRDVRIRRCYKAYRVIKVSLGTGSHIKPGWINSDYEPLNKEILYVNATECFPFPEQSVDYFHTEHMIEHVPISLAQVMLSECYRTLKPGGKIRVATPDIMKLGKLLFDPDARETSDYAEWALKTFPPALEQSTPLTPCMVFNNYMRNWGHQFIYDEKTLTALLIKAGFVSAYRCEINESEDPHLAGQEMRQLAIGDAANSFETMVIEATKPSDSTTSSRAPDR